MGKNFRRPWFLRAAEGLGFGREVDHDEQPSPDEVDVCVPCSSRFPTAYSLPQSLPFTRKCLMKWDSEVVTEGTTHCPGWRGERFEVPDDMRSPLWIGTEDNIPLSTPPHQPIDSVGLAQTAFCSNPFSSHGRWMERSHYFPFLWSSVVESARPSLKKPTGTRSSSTSPIDFSDYATGSEHNSTTGSDPSERGSPPAPPFARKFSRTGDPTRPNSYSCRNKRTRRSKSLEPFADFQGDQTSWVTHGIERMGPPSPEPAEPDASILSDLAPSPGKSSTGSTRSSIDSSRSRASALTDPYPTRRTLATALPRRACPRQRSERGCSIVVMDGDEEEIVWILSREALLDVKGYLQVKKAIGTAIEMPSGWMDGGVQHPHLRAETTTRPPLKRLTRKRVGTSEDNDAGGQKSKQRRSWPEIHPYAFKPKRRPSLGNS